MYQDEIKLMLDGAKEMVRPHLDIGFYVVRGESYIDNFIGRYEPCHEMIGEIYADD